MSKILVPVDGSENSDKAVRYALSLAKGEEDEILLLNVQPYNSGVFLNSFVSRGFFNEIRAYQEKEGKEVLERALQITKDAKATVRTIATTGDPGEGICNEAKDNTVDSIVMGHRGLGPVKRAFLGSVAIQVLQDATCPVTIVR